MMGSAIGATLDLTTVTDYSAAARTLCDWIKRSANIIADPHPDADRTMVRLVVDEFVKNALHGSCILVQLISLPDGSFLITSEDEAGEDHIDPELDGHCGTLIIKTLAGDENYQLQLTNNGQYLGFLRIDPSKLTAT